MRRYALLGLVLALLVVGCGPAASPQSASQPVAPQPPKKIKAAVLHEVNDIGMSGGGLGERSPLNGLTNAGLTNLDEGGTRRPQLAEEVPTLENGLWKLLPDGRMEVSWRLKPNLQWHDGAPLEAADVLFTARAFKDPESGLAGTVFFGGVDNVSAPDPRTVLVIWSKPFIDADVLFPQVLPRHLLEPTFNESRPSFRQLPFWGKEFVGAGPYRLAEFELNSLIRLEAFDRYVFGRPKIDEINIRVITDPSVGLANILAGEVDITIDRGISFEMAMQLRELWREGRVEPIPASAILIWPQLYYTNPVIIQDVRFRRALMHAMNRDEMVATLQGGLTSVLHSIFYPGQPQYEALERTVPRYDYDPRRAIQMIEGVGYSRGPDGIFRDPAGQTLSVELRSSQMSINQKARLAVGDYWKQIGVDVEHHVYPPARQREQPYRATFPGFQLNRNPVDLDIVSRFHSSQLATETTGWRGEDSGYQNSQYDALYERYAVTIPLAERQQLLGQIARHLGENLPLLGLFYDTEPLALKDKMLNVAVPIGGRVTGVASVFSIHLWDVR